MGLPRNGKHGLCMYNYLALGSHATVTLNESPHFQALVSRISALHSPLSCPPPSTTNVTNVPLKRKKWERGIIEFTYFFCALSTPTTLLLPLVTLSLYFEGFQDEMGGGYQSNNLPISYVHSQLLPFIPPPRDTLPLF